MKRAAFCLALSGALMLTGCSNLVSLNSIVTDKQAVMDPALLGIWASQEGKDIYWVSQDGAEYSIRNLNDSGSTCQFKAHLMIAGEIKLLDLVSAGEDPFKLDVHTPMRVWTEGSTLRIAALDSDWLKEQVRQQLPTVLAGDRRTLITAPSEAVANFFVRVGADAKAYDEHGEGRGKKVFRRLQ